MSGAPSSTRSPIRLLDATLIDQIAAGEVIVRPASVVKELVENALDAEATRIAITVADDGCSVTVVDDGAGIPPDEMEIALQRHATSKIVAFDDLSAIESRGFRGEALASIASVARVRLVSRTAESEVGTELLARAGKVEKPRKTGAPRGTRVEVTDLFANVPARRKFLRSAQAEFNAILRIVVQQALSQPHVGITLERVTDTTRRVLDLPPEQSLRDRMAQVMGAEIAEHLVELERTDGDHLLTGYLVKPAVTRRDTRGQHLFVNGRPIANRRLGFALQQALQGVIMTGRKPIAALFLECPPETVDVNVHPTKEEVRFDDEDRAASLVYRAVQAALESADLRPRMEFGGGTKPVPYSLPPDGAPPTQQHFSLTRGASPTPSSATPPSESPSAPSPSIPHPPRAGDLAPEASSPLVNESASSRVLLDPLLDETWTITPLGQISDSYIVAACGDDMLVIDQHAAHERLTYFKVQERFGRQPEGVQPLMVPISFDLPASSLSHLDAMIPIFAELGIEIEPFGGSTLLIRALPSDFEKLDIAAVVRDVAADLERGDSTPTPAQVRDRILTKMACVAAIKANRRLALEEMRALIEEIIRARLPHTCPHGRPTMALLTRDQLDKQFKRS